MVENKDNTTQKDKNNKLFIIIILLVIVLGVCGYICYNKFFNNKESNNNENYGFSETNDEVNTNDAVDTDDAVDIYRTDILHYDTTEFDFDEMSNELHSLIEKEDISTFINQCKNKTTGEDGPPETENTIIEVSTETIDTIINKLKTAKSFEKNITSSWFGCPPRNITYYVGTTNIDMAYQINQKVFTLNYAGINDVLLVSYNNIGYAFYFSNSEEIDNFIESLK